MTNGTMKKLWRLGLALAAVTLPWVSSQANAWCYDCNSGGVYHGSDVSFLAGIRSDYITSHAFARSAQGETLFSRYLKNKELTFYTASAFVRYEFGEPCCCAYTWANHFFIRGNLEFGWLGSGVQRDYVTNQFGMLTTVKSRQHKGKVVDGQAGFGWLGVICSPTLRMGPIAGWGYNLQRMSNKKAKVELSSRPDDEFRLRTADGDSFRTRWRGPFVGWDVLYHVCAWNFECGYEFHWMSLHAFWRRNCCHREKRNRCGQRICPHRRQCEGFLIPLEDAPPGYFSQEIHAKHAYQNVVWSKARWNLHDGFTTAIGAVYKEARSKQGRIHPLKGGFAQVEEPNIKEYRLTKVVWRTFEFQIELGYHW